MTSYEHRLSGDTNGALLVEGARTAAFDRGLWPILDVMTGYHAAIALYEALGWTRAGTATTVMPDGVTFHEHVYLGPALPPPPSG